MEKKLLSPKQTLLMRKILYCVVEPNNYTVTVDDGQYLAFNDGKRFYGLNFDSPSKTYLGIREDGNTRCVFNGIIKTFGDFSQIDSLTNSKNF